MELLIGWGSRLCNSAQWTVVFPPHPGQMLPLYARGGSAETERPTHHHTAFRENQRQSLQRANARGALGIWVSLPLQPLTHGLGGHTHGLGGGACRDRVALWTVTSTVARSTAGERCQSTSINKVEEKSEWHSATSR